MNKSVVGLIIAILVVVAAIVGITVYKNSNTNNEDNNVSEVNEISKENVNDENTSENTNNTDSTTNNKKVLVVYFSAQNHTKTVAEKVAKNLNADIFEIVPEQVYTSDDLNWSDSNSRVSKEHNDESLRNVKLKNTQVNNWEDYDTVLIGYPIWWGIAAWPVDTFVKENNFDGKTVIPFCTSASSGLGQSGELLKSEANSGNWKEGHRFSSGASDTDIQKWTDSLK